MKCIGIIGGTSWESTAHYYAALNRGVQARLGGLHSAKLLMYSVNFAEIEMLQRSGAWDEAGEIYASLARQLEHGGAECIVIAANTMHKVAPQVEVAVGIPVIHIADATARRVRTAGVLQVLFLGTRYTMQEPFITDHLRAGGLDVIAPTGETVSTVNRIIFEELVLGKVIEASRNELLSVIADMRSRHAIEGVILGCTELAMILEPHHVDLPLFDTTAIHVEAALDFSLG